MLNGNAQLNICCFVSEKLFIGNERKVLLTGVF